MDNMQITGSVIQINDRQDFPSGFYKQSIVVECGDRYPNPIEVEFKKDRVECLNGVGSGQKVTIDINIDGREYNGRYFTNISGWRLNIDSAGGGQETDQGQTGGVPSDTPHPPAAPASSAGSEVVEEEVPF